MPPRTSREKACQHTRDCKADEKNINSELKVDDADLDYSQDETPVYTTKPASNGTKPCSRSPRTSREKACQHARDCSHKRFHHIAELRFITDELKESYGDQEINICHDNDNKSQKIYLASELNVIHHQFQSI